MLQTQQKNMADRSGQESESQLSNSFDCSVSVSIGSETSSSFESKEDSGSSATEREESDEPVASTSGKRKSQPSAPQNHADHLRNTFN